MADVDELGGGGATEFGAFRFRDETGKISSAEAGRSQSRPVSSGRL